jgi:L-aminopeptidase/D-esterase-like protein
MIVTGPGNCITDVSGIRVGHHTDPGAGTGCSVLLCEEGATGGVSVMGAFPGSREIAMLGPTSVDSVVHAILLTGGTVFGLDAASGILRYLEGRRKGYRLGRIYVPRVPGAVIFDLGFINHRVRPTADDGFAASESALDSASAEGTIGAGTGATVGKLGELKQAMKGGFGTASVDLGDGVMVGAAVVTNSIGGIYDPADGRVIAGPISANGSIIDSLRHIVSDDYVAPKWAAGTNTTIGVIATNARITTGEANRLATVGHDGIALAVRPAHMQYDGDTLFAIGTGTTETPVDMTRLGAAAAHCVAQAALSGVLAATGLGGIPSVSEMGAVSDMGPASELEG